MVEEHYNATTGMTHFNAHSGVIGNTVNLEAVPHIVMYVGELFDRD